MSGTVHLDSDKILLSIPWSEGWSATVNGKNAELREADIMFMALPLKKGENRISLRYVTPGVIPGLVVSAAAFISILAVSSF